MPHRGRHDQKSAETLGDRVRRLLCELIAIPSYGGREEDIVRYLVERLAAQDIPCRVTEVAGHPMNVVAEVRKGARTIVLNTHVDTVPPGDAALWSTDPLTPAERGGLIHGRGAADAKGCLAAMLVAFEALAAGLGDLACRVVLMAVGGEERGGLGTKAEVAGGLKADAAIVGEATGLIPMIAHKGVLRLEVEVAGKAAHASDPDAGINAITAMGPILVALEGLAGIVRNRSEAYTGHPSLVVSTITGGVALNVIPPSCVLSIDRRVLPTETEADANGEILDVINRALPPASRAQVAVRKVRFVPPSCTSPAAAIVAAAQRAAGTVLGRPVRAAGFPATCDMTYLVNNAGIPTVILGPGSIDMAHQANECIALDQLSQAVDVYRRTVEEWARDGQA